MRGFFWGKLGMGGDPELHIPHPLICHAIDTANVADVLYGQLIGPSCRKAIERAFEPLGGTARGWMAFFAGMHDVGKLSPAFFQAKRGDVAARHLPEPAVLEVERLYALRVNSPGTDTFHGVLTAYHFLWLLEERGAARETASLIAQAVGGHHGAFFDWQAVDVVARAPGDRGDQRWRSWVAQMADQVAGLVGVPWADQLPWSEVRLDTAAAVALAGLATISDWVASHSVPRALHAGSGVDLGAYAAVSKDRARSTVVDELRWKGWRPPEDAEFGSLFGEKPRPVQAVVEAWWRIRWSPACSSSRRPPAKVRRRRRSRQSAGWRGSSV